VLETAMNGKLLAGIAVGAAAALVLGPIVLPPLVRAVRPTTHAAVKTAVRALHGAQEVIAEVAEAAEDAYAEAMAELHAEARTVAAEPEVSPPAPESA
jgi:hypothetical protein